MFDVGWGELFLIAVVALIVVGPKDLPGLFRTLGQFTGRARAMARDFQRTLEAAADEAGVSEVQKTLR
ncbi:twin-arginine translocase subunit TatB, partial [Amaricoccus sp. HAR-UPW-R2A-40]